MNAMTLWKKREKEVKNWTNEKLFVLVRILHYQNQPTNGKLTAFSGGSTDCLPC